MSLSLDKLRLLRKQAGDPKAVTPVAPEPPPPAPAPVAANDAQ
ncbi:exonuclease, partial [Corallococcus exiguus]|nr:exonuclease [Corallococcus exiguus]